MKKTEPAAKPKSLLEQIEQIIREEHESGNKYCWARSAAQRIVKLVTK